MRKLLRKNCEVDKMQGDMLVNGQRVQGRTISFNENGFTVEDENDVVYKEDLKESDFTESEQMKSVEKSNKSSKMLWLAIFSVVLFTVPFVIYRLLKRSR